MQYAIEVCVRLLLPITEAGLLVFVCEFIIGWILAAIRILAKCRLTCITIPVALFNVDLLARSDEPNLLQTTDLSTRCLSDPMTTATDQ